jgi:MFS family permease
LNHNKEGYPSPGRAWTMVVILLLAYVLSFSDRQILNLLVEPIERDLDISDTQMSLLMGFSFAVFYTVCGIPLGRLADSKSRRGIIAVGVFFWSLMTAACGLARQYWQLMLARFGVGVGEAALSPSAYSLIADSFPKETRATAISVYSMGIYLGSGIALLLGGVIIGFAAAQAEIELPVLGAIRSWQLIFFLLGAAGVLFSATALAIREPARHGVGAGVLVPLREVARYLRANRATVVCHNVGFAMVAFASYGAGSWIPEFFKRTYGWTPLKIGLVYGGIVMVFGALGIVCGGWLSDRLSRNGQTGAPMRVGLFATAAAIPFSIFFPLLGENGAAAMLVFVMFLLSMPFGVAAAAIQEIMPNPMRGQASALYLFVVNLLGLGVGPTAVALVTDYVFHDGQSLRYSLLIVMTGGEVIALGLLWLGLKPYRESVERLRNWSS